MTFSINNCTGNYLILKRNSPHNIGKPIFVYLFNPAFKTCLVSLLKQ